MLRVLNPEYPSELLNGPMGEWAYLILFCAFFSALFQVALPRHLSKGNRFIAIILGIIAGIGLYVAKQTLNFSFESFGFLAFALLIFVLAMATYGLLKSGMPKDLAFTVSYALLYLTFIMVTPSLYDTLARSMPPVALIVSLGFAVSVVYSIYAIYKRISPNKSSPSYNDVPNDPTTRTDRQNERQDEKDTKQSIKLSKKELHTADDLISALDEMEKTLSRHSQLTQADAAHLREILERMRSSKDRFVEALKRIHSYLEKAETTDRQAIQDMRSRLDREKDRKKRAQLKAEITVEEKKHNLRDFIKKNESQIMHVLNDFQNRMGTIIEAIRMHKTSQARTMLSEARKKLESIRHLLKELKHHEKHTYTFEKMAERRLKREAT